MADGRQRAASGPWKTLGVGAAAIAALAVVAMVVVSVSMKGCGGKQEDTAAGSPEREPSAPAGAALPGRFSPGGATAPAPPAPLPEDLDPSWRDSRAVFRLRELGADTPYVVAGLRDARGQMSRCFEAESAARPGTAPADPEAAGSPAVLVLYLESREGAIDVVEVREESLGTASRSLVECCRDVLRGHEIRSPKAVPGRRYRVHYPLQ
jgi:hypothetical protein